MNTQKDRIQHTRRLLPGRKRPFASSAATLVAGAGSDLLVGGTGGTTYQFAAASGSDVVVEPSATVSDTVDFSQFPGPVNLDMTVTTVQWIGGIVGTGLALQLVNALSPLTTGPALISNFIGNNFGGTFTGNGSDKQITVNGGTWALHGGSGQNAYFFNQGAGQQSSVVITDSKSTSSDSLNFEHFGTSINLDLSSSVQQPVAPNLKLTLSDPSAFSTVVGSPFSDVIKGNGNNDTLIGGGGQDMLVAGSGSDVLQAGKTQVVLLDFTTFTVPGAWNFGACWR